MRNPLSKTVVELEPSGIRRFFDVANTMENVISLGVGEPDFDTPWHIREEGIYSLEKGRTYYTSNAGLLPLRREISRYLHERFELPYGEEEILVTVGGSEAIDICMRAMLDPGDEVIIPEPCFVSYLPTPHTHLQKYILCFHLMILGIQIVPYYISCIYSNYLLH